MKRIIAAGFLAVLFVSLVSSQTGEHYGGRFLKRIEYNKMMGEFNLDSKGYVEKLFFGDFNAPVEFLYWPAFEGASGFRIIRDSLNTSYILEVKHILNYKDAAEKANEKYPYSNPKYFEEIIKLYKVETRSYPISNRFAEKIYEEMVSTINNFKAKSVSMLVNDGYSVTFRTVVEDEVWTLNIHMPQGDALKMADLCRQIMADADADKF